MYAEIHVCTCTLSHTAYSHTYLHTCTLQTPHTHKPNPTHLTSHASTLNLPTSVHTASTHICGPHTYLTYTYLYLYQPHTCTLHTPTCIPYIPVLPICLYPHTCVSAPSSNTQKTIEASSPHLEATVPIMVFQGHSLPESSRKVLPPSSAFLGMQVPHPRLCLSCLGLLLWAFPVPFFLRTIVIECEGFPSHKSSHLDVINCTRTALFPNKATFTVFGAQTCPWRASLTSSWQAFPLSWAVQ